MSATSASATRAAKPKHPEDGKPWWKFAHVWLVLAGPAIVVIAGLVTAYIAMSKPDPVIDPDYYRHGIEINQRLDESQKSLAPALTGRNHAATPAQDHPTDR
ncbi:MAG: FixH family protein [Comamonas sp.]|jgi:hypothetical protein|uniref:FixH family protein n=1 Tax=Comamonas sp. TaxID=34028 RepID=UPI0028175D68|nr:FixH family protein [Comamonas sp.]MDR0212605.1 FixH family protein [Comamonas sp.]MDR2297186.1 FixH family protein [Comamonas sp.]